MLEFLKPYFFKQVPWNTGDSKRDTAGTNNMIQNAIIQKILIQLSLRNQKFTECMFWQNSESVKSKTIRINTISQYKKMQIDSYRNKS